jgi:hypothetical protein
MPDVETSTPPDTSEPIGAYNHVAKVGNLIMIGSTGGHDPATGQLAGQTSSRKPASFSTTSR